MLEDSKIESIFLGYGVSNVTWVMFDPFKADADVGIHNYVYERLWIPSLSTEEKAIILINIIRYIGCHEFSCIYLQGYMSFVREKMFILDELCKQYILFFYLLLPKETQEQFDLGLKKIKEQFNFNFSLELGQSLSEEQALNPEGKHLWDIAWTIYKIENGDVDGLTEERLNSILASVELVNSKNSWPFLTTLLFRKLKKAGVCDNRLTFAFLVV